MKLLHITTSGKATPVEAKDAVFGVKPDMSLLSRAVHVYLSNQRQGTSKVKTRSEIARTKKKWFRQKGTGNARHGARTPNIFVGGGVSHGPTGMENWSKTLTKQQRKNALIHALSSQKGNIVVLEGISALSGKTKDADTLLRNVSETPVKMLVILHETVEPAVRAMKNLENVLVTRADRLNVYEVMLSQKVVLTPEAVRVLEEKLGKTKSAGKKATPKAMPKPVANKASVKKTAKPAVKKTATKRAKKAAK